MVTDVIWLIEDIEFLNIPNILIERDCTMIALRLFSPILAVGLSFRLPAE